MELKGKKVTVVGLARSGAGAANLMARMGAEVTVTDMKSGDELRDEVSRLSPSIRLHLGGHPEGLFLSADMLVISPGVPSNIRPLVKARESGIPVVGELELAYRVIGMLQEKDSNKTPFLAVTGSNGKSTTTTLLDHMLRKSGRKTLLAGNIGNALSEELYQEMTAKGAGLTEGFSWDDIVLEVSSFQLETIDRFRPHIAAVLNITPDHMDRYHDAEDYKAAKARIAENQNGADCLVLNADDPETAGLGRKPGSRKGDGPSVFYFSRMKAVDGVYWKDGEIFSNIPGLPDLRLNAPLIRDSEIMIKGVHNLENAMAASAMALLANCPARAVIESLREFRGLEHRLELVREIRGVRYINDSKGTNVGAVLKSIDSFSEPVILIAGGRDKAGDFSALRTLVAAKVKALILIGEAAEKIQRALGELTDTVLAKDLRDAVRISEEKAEKGDVVLLSPACASFDMFRDFEDRGRQFKELVREIRG